MAEGLAALDSVDLTIIGNVADDEEFHGLWVSPDIDTLTYSLAGIIDRDKGWGVADEGLRALETLQVLGEETWMTLGDRDFGLHIYRTMRRARGDRPSQIAADVARAFGVACRIVLSTDDAVQTRIRTPEGWLQFQEYFVRERCRPEVLDVDYAGIDKARPTAEALHALDTAEIIVIAPSNPVVSIAPILRIPGMTEALRASSARKIAISPLIAGKTVKGPAAEMMRTLKLRPDAAGVAEFYRDLVDVFVIDHRDTALADDIEALGQAAHATDILMQDQAGKARLAAEIVQWAMEGTAQ